MPSIEVGRVCMKVVGREAGNYCVVVKPVSKSFADITGPKILTGVKRRRVNIVHLEPTQYSLEIKEGATDEEVVSAFEKAGLVSKLNLKIPSAAEMKEHAKKRQEKEEARQKTEAAEKKKTKKKE